MATLTELFESLGNSVNTMTDDLRNAELENKMAEDDLGVSGTDVSQIPMGVLNALDAMSGNRGQLALDYANQAIPMPEEANKYEAALRFFLEMGKQASQPGSTVLGSAFGAGQAPLDYLTAKNAEIRKAKQARAALGLQIAPSLKPKAVGKATYDKPDFYMVSKADGKGGFTTPVETPLTPKQFSELPTDGSVRVTSLSKAGTKFGKRTLYSDDGSTIDVYDEDSYDQAIRDGYGRVKTDDFKSVTLYKNGSSVEARSQAEFDILTSQEGGGWSRIKPAAQSTAQYKRTVYKDGRELTVYSKEDYNTATSEEGGWSPEKPAPAGPQGTAPERMTSRIFGFVDTFIENGGVVGSRQLAQFISDVKDMAEPETITFVEDGVSKTATTPGKDAYEIIETAYNKTVANSIKDIAIQNVDDGDDGDGGGDGDDDDDGKPLLQTVVIAGKEYTVFSEKDPSIPKEAVQGIVDSNGGMIDVKIASDVLFKDGKYNRLAAIASNLLPGGGAGPSGSLTGDSRTAYQAMKRSIELLLRARSGAAVPPAEVDNYMALYYPSTLDNDEQARNKLNVLAQYFSDTNRLLSQGKLNEGRGTYDRAKHGIPLDSSVSNQVDTAPEAVTVVSQWELDGVKYKQLSDGRIIEEGAE